MPNWLIKSALQRTISVLPWRQRWNEVLQWLSGTGSLELTNAKFESRLEHTRRHLANFRSGRPGDAGPFTALELGTGWFPTMIIGLYLCGAERIWTIDIDPLLKRARVKRVLEFFCAYDDRGQLQKDLPEFQPERMSRVREALAAIDTEVPETCLRKLNIEVMVRDAQDTTLPDGSVDLFFSTGVLEYIPRPVLSGIFREFSRVGTRRMVMSHWISMVDQFSYFDRSITPFNYMRYTARQWRYLNSPLTWQNRLRVSDYRQLLKETGFEIVREEHDHIGSESDLASLQLAPEFGHYTREDLLVLKTWITAMRAGR